MYTVDGGRHLPERELDHLAGYAGRRPVRIGNGAVEQRQTDVLGEVMCALDQARNNGVRETRDSWTPAAHAGRPARRAAGTSPTTACGRSAARCGRFTHSRVMVWAAFDRAVRAVEEHGLEGPVDEWRELRDEVRDEVMTHGYDAERNTFTQHYDTREVDASLLVLPQVGFVRRRRPADARHDRGGGAGPDARRAAAALPHRDRRGRAVRRRVPLRGLLVLAGLGVRAGRTDRRRHAG